MSSVLSCEGCPYCIDVFIKKNSMNQDSFILHLISKHKSPCFVDAVGTGALFSGPVACAVSIPEPFNSAEVNDSKQLDHETIYHLAPGLKEKVVYSFGSVSSFEMLSIRNNLKTELLAMTRAVLNLKEKISVDSVFVDGKYALPDTKVPSYAVIKGDGKVFGIAVSSIIAKDYRDHFMMKNYGERYKRYHINSNMGYRSPDHLIAIRRWGTVYPYHRTWLPQIQSVLSGNYDSVIFSKYKNRWECLV